MKCIAGRVPCERPVVAVLTVGCLHEHLRTGPICAHHIERKRLCCRACLDHPTQPHDRCPVQTLASEPVPA